MTASYAEILDILKHRPDEAISYAADAVSGRRASHGSVAGDAVPFGSYLGVDERDTTRAREQTDDSELTDQDLFARSVDRSRRQLLELETSEEHGLVEVAALIFGSHRAMLDDDSVSGEMMRRIAGGQTVRAAIIDVVEEHAARFARVTEARIAEKEQDIRDLGYRLLNNLADRPSEAMAWAGRIVIARHVFPSDLARLAIEGAAGAVLIGAAVTAHISILASSLGIPVLITEERRVLAIAERTPLILDADSDLLMVQPSAELESAWRAHLGSRAAMPAAFHLQGRSADGRAFPVMANVNLLKDALAARRQGAEGIGLYRSEFPFILRNDFLTEDEQMRVYRSIVTSMAGKPVTLRTADIGGDKLLQGRGTPEDNPFLGVRGVRFSLANEEMFRTQIRAMLRAGHGAELGIMLPMVSGVEEVLDARRIIEDVAHHLQREGVAHNESPRIGAMVELPSAALAVPDLARETDFLSIGTNDLTMYLLAVDRTNEHLSHLYRSYHPSVLQILHRIVADARDAGVPVSVCGDAAADPVMTPFFCGIGVDALSVSPGAVERTKSAIAARTRASAETYAREMLDISRVSEMERYLATQLQYDT